MYSSVPTNEFDCVVGSATKIGGGWSLDLLLVGVACLITCTFFKELRDQFLWNIAYT